LIRKHAGWTPIVIEKADQELVLQRRQGQGGAGIQRRGTRPFTFKTTFGEVTVQRSRISHNLDGTINDIVPQEGEPLIVAQRERARAVLDGASEAQLALLGPWGFSAASGGCWSWETVPHGFEHGSRAWGFPSKLVQLWE